jgi:hypothetical protein
LTAQALMTRRVLKKRRWGYFVWVVAGFVIGFPEITAASGGDLPFTTISEMVGHLEFLWPPTELLVIAAIVLGTFSHIRKPPPTPPPSASEPGAPADEAGGGARPARTPGGRLTSTGVEATGAEAAAFDEERAPLLFAVAAVVSLAAISVGTWAAVQWWDDSRHFHPAYVLYGSAALLWLVIPSVVAFVWGSDPPFPTLFRTVKNLEDWLSSIRLEFRGRLIGPMLAWLVSFVILWGLVVLLLHLTLYPFPDNTKIFNPNG